MLCCLCLSGWGVGRDKTRMTCYYAAFKGGGGGGIRDKGEMTCCAVFQSAAGMRAERRPECRVMFQRATSSCTICTSKGRRSWAQPFLPLKRWPRRGAD